MATPLDAFVLDIGNLNTCWGYAGDDEPQQVHTSAWNFHSKDGWLVKHPSEFLTLKQNCTPCWTIVQSGLPEPLFTYIQHVLDKDSIEETTAPPGITGSLSKTVLMHELNYINSFFGPEHGPRLKDRPLLISEPSKRPQSHSNALAEAAFEEIEVSAFYSCRKASLAACATGRPTSLVVELGPVGTTLSPVFEGFTLQRQVQQYAVGGFLLDWMCASTMKLWDVERKQFDPEFVPCQSALVGRGTHQRYDSFSIATDGKTGGGSGGGEGERELYEGVTAPFIHHCQTRIIQDLRETVLRIQDYKPAIGAFDAPLVGDSEEIPYQLPDGRVIYVPTATSKSISEFLFTPTKARLALESLRCFKDSLSPMIANFPGVPTAIVSTAFRADVDIRPTMLQNVVVTGGLAATEGLLERIASDLTSCPEVDISDQDRVTALLGGSESSASAPTLKDVSSIKFKVAAQTPPERRFTTWTGGSILSTLTSFRHAWISKEEWSEAGTSILDRKQTF